MPHSALTSMPHLTPSSTPRPFPSSPPHLASLSTPHLSQSSTACHKSSTRLIHPNQPSIPSPELEKSREELVRGGEFLANQARLSVQASPKNTKIQKKLPSLDQVSYAPTSCIHSSLTGNQCGSSSYSLSHRPITVQVYASNAHHSPPSTCPPSESHANGNPGWIVSRNIIDTGTIRKDCFQ